MQADSQTYANCMVQIKRRISVIEELLPTVGDQFEFTAENCEHAALQLRMIYELLGFASLSANRNDYVSVRKIYEKEWNLSEILKVIDGINPDFLPVPAPSDIYDLRGIFKSWDSIDDHIKKSKDSPLYLTRSELARRHGYLGNFLHARNPYGRPFDLRDLAYKILIWKDHLITLLNLHIAVVKAGHYFHVNMATAPDGRVVVSELTLGGKDPYGL